MRLLISYGSKGKYFHMKEFGDALKKRGVPIKIVKDTEYSVGFPSKKISSWFGSYKKFEDLIKQFKPDAVFTDRQTYFGLDTIKSKIPLFILLRGHYWSEQEWAKKTIHTGIKSKVVLFFRNRISEKCFDGATVIFPICGYLQDIVKEHYPKKNTNIFFEGIDPSKWYKVETNMELVHPCVGLLQDANWWGKTKEMMVLKNVLKSMPNVKFYWAGDGPYREKILEELDKFENFVWLGRLDYPDKVREFLSEIDIYALISGMDLAPLTLKEAQLMKKPVIGTSVGGIPEMMEDKITGFLVKEGDSDDLIKKLTNLLDDDVLKNKMGNAGREFIMKNFGWDVITEKFIQNITQYIKK